jgi:L-fuculose-phosphate aldolase
MTQALAEITSKSSRAEIERFFNGPEVKRYKEEICDVGRRMWQRAYVDGNGGNLAIRVTSDLVLCTPTLVSKGFMKPEDLCLVDLNGVQMAGDQRRTSEILMHLEIMKRQPRAVATVHGHPPYGTAYGLAGLLPPTGRISEYELFVSTALAPYRTPGTPDLGFEVAALADRHNTILMANHGVVAWSHNSVEDAYFKLEILEAYCQTLCIASQLGRPLSEMTPAQVKDLLAIKARFGIPDPRMGG